MNKPVATKARQTIPRWSIAPQPQPRRPVSHARSATIIALPRPGARDRRVLTYPAAITLPTRVCYDADDAQRPFSLIALIALAAPSALVCCAVLLLGAPS